MNIRRVSLDSENHKNSIFTLIMKMNKAALFVLTVLLVQINSIYSQGGQTSPNCSALKIDCPRNTRCLKKARESISLSCYFTQSWFKTPDSDIGRFGKVINQEKYEHFFLYLVVMIKIWLKNYQIRGQMIKLGVKLSN